jgi:hypothetical protein
MTTQLADRPEFVFTKTIRNLLGGLDAIPAFVVLYVMVRPGDAAPSQSTTPLIVAHRWFDFRRSHVASPRGFVKAASRFQSRTHRAR